MSQRARLKKNRDSVRGYAVKKRDSSGNSQKTTSRQNTTRRKVRRKRK